MTNYAPYYAQGPFGQAPVNAPSQNTESSAMVPARRLSTVWGIAGTAASAALAYHGYKRNNSIIWGLAWAIAGGLVWPVGLAIAVAQGFGRPAVQRNRGRRSRRNRS